VCPSGSRRADGDLADRPAFFHHRDGTAQAFPAGLKFREIHPSPVRREKDRTYVAGLEGYGIGCKDEHDNSVIACIAGVMAAWVSGKAAAVTNGCLGRMSCCRSAAEAVLVFALQSLAPKDDRNRGAFHLARLLRASVLPPRS